MKRALVFFLALVVVAGVIVGITLSRTHSDTIALPTREVDTFLHAWARGNTADMATLLDRPVADLDAVASSLVKAVPGSSATYTRTGLSGAATDATATYHAQVNLQGLGAIAWDGTLALQHSKATGWRITWNPSELYPGLETGQHLTVTRTWPARASILAANGSVLAGAQATVVIGLEPDHIKTPADLATVKVAMKATLAVDPATIDKVLHAPGIRPNYFLPVITVPRDRAYQKIHDTLLPIPGIIFRAATGVSSVDAPLGSQVLGTVGDITADGLKKLGAPYTVGDQVGLSGLEAVYEKQLAGTPRRDVVIVDAKGNTAKLVKRFPGKAAQPVRLTIDPTTQKAAEAALAGVGRNAGLVAVDTTTGAIRAVVSKPYDGFSASSRGPVSAGLDFQGHHRGRATGRGRQRIHTGAVPTQAHRRRTDVLELRGRSTRRARPRARVRDLVQQRVHRPRRQAPDRSAGPSRGVVRIQHALVARRRRGGRLVPDSERRGRARRVGHRAGARAREPGRDGFGRRGRRVRAVARADPRHRAGAAVNPVGSPALDAVVVSTLRSFMASVVRAGGTAAGAGLPADSFGKTGTAEFGQGNPPPTHAWFIGYRGNLAYAVIVEGGGVGGAVAAPIAAAFLRALPK